MHFNFIVDGDYENVSVMNFSWFKVCIHMLMYAPAYSANSFPTFWMPQFVAEYHSLLLSTNEILLPGDMLLVVMFANSVMKLEMNYVFSVSNLLLSFYFEIMKSMLYIKFIMWIDF